MKTEDIKKRLGEIAKNQDKLLEEKAILMQKLYRQDSNTKLMGIIDIKKRLDTIFSEVSDFSLKFHQSIDDFNLANKNIQLLQKERETLIKKLRQIESF